MHKELSVHFSPFLWKALPLSSCLWARRCSPAWAAEAQLLLEALSLAWVFSREGEPVLIVVLHKMICMGVPSPTAVSLCHGTVMYLLSWDCLLYLCLGLCGTEVRKGESKEWHGVRSGLRGLGRGCCWGMEEVILEWTRSWGPNRPFLSPCATSALLIALSLGTMEMGEG